MKLTSSARTHSAAMMRSPSFSRSSSSMSTAILPALMSARISSIVLNSLMMHLLFWFAEQPIKIARDRVDFDIHARVDDEIAQRRDLAGVRNDVHVEPKPAHLIDGEAHPVDADRTLGRDEAHQCRRQFELQPPRTRVLGSASQTADGIDVTAHQMPAERIAGAKTGLEVHPRPAMQVAERRLRQGFTRNV